MCVSFVLDGYSNTYEAEGFVIRFVSDWVVHQRLFGVEIFFKKSLDAPTLCSAISWICGNMKY